MIHHGLSMLLHLLIHLVLLLNDRLKSYLLLDWCFGLLYFNLFATTDTDHYFLLPLDLSLIIPKLAFVLPNVLVAFPLAVSTLVPILTACVFLVLVYQAQYIQCAKWGYWRHLHVFKFPYIFQITIGVLLLLGFLIRVKKLFIFLWLSR